MYWFKTASSSAKTACFNDSSTPSDCCAIVPKELLVEERADTPVFTSVRWVLHDYVKERTGDGKKQNKIQNSNKKTKNKKIKNYKFYLLLNSKNFQTK